MNYAAPASSITQLRFPDIDLAAGAELALLGPSGSGKTTLLHCLAGLLRPSQGEVQIAGQTLTELNERELGRFRTQNIGIVFQDFYLLAGYSALENVTVALAATGQSLSNAKTQAKQLLSDLGLGKRLHAKPGQLSTGERQRVAVARASAAQPLVLLADEPTANLDRSRADDALELLRHSAKRSGAALIIATHDPRIMAAFERRIELT